MTQRDSIYSKPVTEVNDFAFDEQVVKVFPDMIKRSVPGYSTVIAMTGVLAGQYAQENSNCYDLGCSLGESSYAMMQQIKTPGCKIIGVDNSSEMITKCQAQLAAHHTNFDYELVCDDILNVGLKNASVVVLNYTLQFIDVRRRDDFIKKVFDSLLPGGIILLSEKIKFEDPEKDRRMIDMHHQFKKANGYSDLEISQKRTALENVLLPETLDTHANRLTAAGFEPIDIWFQCFNFISLMAKKPS